MLLVLAEALLTRTGWKLPQLALPERVKREPRVKVAKPKQAVEVLVEPVKTVEEAPAAIPVEESARSARFQRAKDKR